MYAPHLGYNIIDDLSTRIEDDACKLLDNIGGAYYGPTLNMYYHGKC